MASRRSSGGFRPFDDLAARLKKHRRLARRGRPATARATPAGQTASPPAPAGEDEDRLFREAMAGTVPLGEDRQVPPAPPRREAAAVEDPDREVLRRLERLVRDGRGFSVCDTPEYIEGGDSTVCPEITRRLHAGGFALQAFVDLHGLTVSEARSALDRFLSDARRKGHRGVLIVHGRGLRSPGEPALKRLVKRRLSSGPWARWVLTFASARMVDGGAGATCVLLRDRPRPRRTGGPGQPTRTFPSRARFFT